MAIETCAILYSASILKLKGFNTNLEQAEKLFCTQPPKSVSTQLTVQAVLNISSWQLTHFINLEQENTSYKIGSPVST